MPEVPQEEENWYDKKIRERGLEVPPQEEQPESWYEKQIRLRAAEMNVVVDASKQISPDLAARVVRQERKTGLPTDMLAENLESIEAETAKADFNIESFRKTSPVVFNWVKSSPFYYKLLQEPGDLEKVQNIELLLTRPKHMWPMPQPLIEERARKAAEHRAATRLAIFGMATSIADPEGYKRAQASLTEEFYPGELAQRMDEERRIGSQDQKGFFEHLGQRFNENPVFWAPFLSAVPDMDRALELYDAAKHVEAGTASYTESELLLRYARLAESDEMRGTSIIGKTAGIISELPAFALEFGATGGVFSGAKGLILKGGKEAAESLLRRSIANIVGAVAQTAVAMPIRTATNTIQRMTPQGEIASKGEFITYRIVPGSGESFGVALSKAVVTAFAEIASERTGKLFEVLDRPLNKALFGWWLGKHPNATADAFQKFLVKNGVHGVLGEMGEERIGDLMKWAGGVQPFPWPDANTPGNLAAEALAFSVPQAASFGAARLFKTPIRSNPTFFEQLGANVQNLKVMKTAPEKIEEIISLATKGKANEFVYTPVDTWNTYWQGQKDAQGLQVDPRAMAREVLGSVTSYDEAVQSGSDLQIPMSRYAVTIAATAHNDYFKDELRSAPTEMNGREQKDLEVQIGEEAAGKEAPRPESEVGVRVRGQLRSAGFDEPTTEAYAQLYESTFTTLAERSGTTPAELFSRYALQIGRPDLAVPGAIREPDATAPVAEAVGAAQEALVQAGAVPLEGAEKTQAEPASPGEILDLQNLFGADLLKEYLGGEGLAGPEQLTKEDAAYLASAPTLEAARGAISGRRAAITTAVRQAQLFSERAEGVPETFTRKSAEDAGVVRLLNSPVAAVHEPAETTTAALTAEGFSSPTLYELAPSDESAKTFVDAITAAKKTNDFGAAVYVYSEAEYKAMRLFANEDGSAGFALKGDDIVSIFKNTNTPATGSVVDAMMLLAVKEGGRRLDAFDTILPVIYAPHGFTVVARTKWNEQIVPPGWDKQVFAEFNNGEPDVVYMVYDPAQVGREYGGAEEGEVVATTEEAVQRQTDALAGIQAAPTAPEALGAPQAGAEAVVEGQPIKIPQSALPQAGPAALAVGQEVRVPELDGEVQAVVDSIEDELVRVKMLQSGRILSFKRTEVSPWRPPALPPGLAEGGIEPIKLNVTYFQLPKDKEPKGYRQLSKYLTETEKAKMRADSAKRFVEAFQELPPEADFEAAALAGVVKRGWYERSAAAIRDVFGDVDAPRFAALLAAMSPQSSVESNLINASNTWKNWIAAGRPTDREKILDVMAASVQGTRGRESILPAWINNSLKSLQSDTPQLEVLSGPKVNSFMLNLRGVVNEVTIDAWMANFASLNARVFGGALNPSGTDPGKGTAYLAFSAKVRKVAAKLGWTPSEVQETIWSWTKTAYELGAAAGEERSIEELVRQGAITDEAIAETPDFAKLFTEDASIRTILEKAGYGEVLKAVEEGFAREPGRGPAAAGERIQEPRGEASRALLRNARRLDQLIEQRLREERETAERAASAAAVLGIAKPRRARGRDARPEEIARAVRARAEPVAGLPASQPGPILAIRQAADLYSAFSGVPYREPSVYVKADPARGARIIAKAFDDMKHDPRDPQVAVAYRAMINETLAQYQFVKKLGIKIDVIKAGMDDPYPEGPRQVHDDVRRGHIWFFPTSSGHGTLSEIRDNPLLEPTDEFVGDHRMLANDIFRVVHDIFGHAKEGFGFGPHGEENAWQSHMRMYSPLAARAMTTETRGQNSWVNYGPYGEQNRAEQKKTVYADQKVGILPSWVSEEGLAPDRERVFFQAGAMAEPAGRGPVTETAAFKKWFGESVAVERDQEGNPLKPRRPVVVYRGEHGVTDAPIHTRLPSITFTDDPAVASIYATQPNNRDDQAEASRMIPAYLSIQNPILVNTDDPFIDLSTLRKALGNDEARRIALKFARRIESASWWEESHSNNMTVEKLLEELREGDRDLAEIDEMFVDAYVYLDDAEEVAALKAKGYDGAIHKGSGESMDALEYRVFDQKQIKSAIPKRGNIFFHGETFYHKIQRVIAEKMDNSATVEQVRGIIKDIKEEERKWSGVDEFLAGKEKVTKAELLEFLRANQIEIKEVTKGHDIARATLSPDVIIEEEDDGSWMLRSHTGEEGPFSSREEAEAFGLRYGYTEADSEASEGGPDTKFSQYVLSGGQNYRELLLTMPEKGHFESRHFSEPNILAHVRFNDRVDADGKKVLFIEEIQSDWHQQGRKKGYTSDKYAKLKALQKEGLSDAVDAALRDMGRLGFDALVSARAAIRDNPDYEDMWEIEEKYKPLLRRYYDHAEAEARLEERGGGVPDAPFKKTWHEFALKRMIRYAAENGYGKVAWTTGAQQVKRYPEALRQVVDLITWTAPDEAGDRHVQALKGDAVQFTGSLKADGTFSNGAAAGKDIAEVFGKGMAEKIVSSNEPGRLEGKDFTVGGEGMKGFYDEMIPNFLNKFGKKYGARVGTASISLRGPADTGAPARKQHYGMEHDIGKEPVVVYDELTNERFPFATREEGQAFISRRLAAELGEIEEVQALPITAELKKAALEEGFPLFQPGKEGARGQIRIGPNGINIDLLKNADLSTFLHESGHFYLEVLADLATAPDAPAEIKKDFETVLEWMGVKSRAEIGEAQQEQWARGFEAYLSEGKAPTSALRAAFAKFRAWLIAVYRELRKLNVTLTPEVRNVMDRMLATNEELEAARIEQQMAPLFADPAAVGMTEKQATGYREAIEEAKRAAEEELTAKVIGQVQREQKSWWKEEREKVSKEVESEVNEQKEYFALTTLQESTPEQKLNFVATADLVGGERMAKLPKDITTKLGTGLTPDQAADLFGFKSGDEMLAIFEQLQPREKLINQLTTQRMRARHGDLLLDGTMPVEAMKAIHNEKRSLLLRKELEYLVSEEFSKFKGLVRRMARPLPPLAAVRSQAEQAIAIRKVSAINPLIYQRAEVKAGKAAVDALLRGNIDDAFKAKQQELFNHELYRAASAAREDVDSIVKYMARFGKSSTRERIGKAGADYLEQIDAILDRFDFRKSISQADIAGRKGLAKWVAEQEEKGNVVEVPEKLLNDAYRQHYKDTVYEELVGIRDTVKNIEHLAKLKNQLLKDAKKREVDAAVAEAVTSIEKHSKGKRKKEIETRLPQFDLPRLGAGILASHRKFASYARQMDGFEDGGVLWELLVRPMNEAGDTETAMKSEAATKLSEIFSVYKAADIAKMYRKEFIPQIQRSLTRMGQLMVALNWGNADNRQKLLDGYEWDPHQVQAILDRLDERDWKFVQSVWDYIDTYWPESKALSERVTGLAPEKVEAQELVTKFGTFRGGYFPLKYDERQSPKAFANVAKEAAERALRGATIRSTTKHGHRKDRVQGVKKPIRLDFGSIFEHVSEVIHDQTHYEFLIDVNKLLGNEKLQEAMIDHYGDQVYRQLTSAIQDIAGGDVASQTSFEKAINWLRTGTSISAMGWNFMTALAQPLGITQSIVRIGPKWFARGMMRWLGDAARMENTVRWIQERSSFMANRAKTQLREINEIRNHISAGSKIGVYVDVASEAATGGRFKFSRIGESYFWLITRAQMIADVPTWLGAYEKAMAELKPESAGSAEEIKEIEKRVVALADQAVLDAQGGGQVKDLAQIQRGGPLLKLWTNFYNYFNTTFNLTAESIARTNFKSPFEVGRLAGDLLLLYTVPAVLGLLVREAIKGKKGGDDDLAKKLVGEQASYLLGTMVGLRELGAAARGFHGYEGPAGARFFAEFGGLVKQISQGEIDAGFWKDLNDTSGILFHYPSGQVNRFVNGFAALQDGDTANPAVILTGPPKK